MSEPTLNREAWLQAAVQKLRPMFQGFNHVVPDIAVSVGWPSSGGLAKKRKTIGQCWYGTMTANNVPQLFISPLLDEAATADGVLATLVHEVVHVIAGPDAKHGPRFVKVMPHDYRRVLDRAREDADAQRLRDRRMENA